MNGQKPGICRTGTFIGCCRGFYLHFANPRASFCDLRTIGIRTCSRHCSGKIILAVFSKVLSCALMTCRPPYLMERGLHLKKAMKVSDLIIIYFACGSPLGVYYFTRLPEGASAGSVVWTLLRLLAWPVSAAVLLRARFLDAPPSDEAILDRKISDIR